MPREKEFRNICSEKVWNSLYDLLIVLDLRSRTPENVSQEENYTIRVRVWALEHLANAP